VTSGRSANRSPMTSDVAGGASHPKIRETAEAQFKRTQKPTYLKEQTLPKVNSKTHVVFVKTARLKELRLAKEAVDSDGGLAHGDRAYRRMPKTST
jgi:hypothetical protein